MPLRSKELHLVDARAADPRALTDAALLRSAARAAVGAGGGHVLDESLVRFPNGAITLVLVLAESHLSLHTWPEERLVAIDLFSCGAIDGARVLDVLRVRLGLRSAAVRKIGRGA
ncbi:MAG TPA: adenosylmethionine decarboxylase [Candidatus Dormibacteraeota bacterium]|nr:adenosylmethionine decarboxylase [Candidatus Dormibacteraeota bacterium]